MKPVLKPPGTKRLNLKCDKLHSTSAFKFNLRRYTEGGAEGGAGLEGVSIAGADVSMAQLKKWLEFPRHWGPTEVGRNPAACHVIHRIVYQRSPFHPPHIVPVLTTSPTR